MGASLLHAFPLAPFLAIYGDVRDEQGVLIPPTGAAVVMSQGGAQRMREPLTATSGADFNYQLRMRMDMNRRLTETHRSLVVSTASAYSLAVDIGGVLCHPIEITATPPTVESTTSRVRLNLTLGVDSGSGRSARPVGDQSLSTGFRLERRLAGRRRLVCDGFRIVREQYRNHRDLAVESEPGWHPVYPIAFAAQGKQQ
jgi:hypothetical protein